MRTSKPLIILNRRLLHFSLFILHIYQLSNFHLLFIYSTSCNQSLACLETKTNMVWGETEENLNEKTYDLF